MLCNNILCPTSKSRILDTVIKKHTQAVDVHPPTGSLVAPEFVKIEKNLNTLGFFTPAKHKGQKSREKIITMRRELGGKVVEAHPPSKLSPKSASSSSARSKSIPAVCTCAWPSLPPSTWIQIGRASCRERV